MVSLPVILAIIFIVCLTHLLQEAENDLKRQAFAADVMARATELHRLFFDAGYDIFLFHTTRSERYGAEFDATEKQIVGAQKELSELLSHVDADRGLIEQSLKDSQVGLALMSKIRHGAPPEFGGSIDLRTFQRDGQKMNHKLFEDYMKIYDYAKRIRDQAPASSSQSRQNIVNFLFALVGINVILAIGLATYFTRTITMRLLVINDNSGRVARNAPLNQPLDGSDEIASLDQSFRAMALHIDEAARKERALTDNAREVLCSIDKSLKFVKLSPACEKVWGFKSDDLIETRIRNLLPDDDAEETISNFQDLITNLGERAFTSRIIRKDGKVIDVRWSVFWSESEQAIFCVCHDITQEKELERMKQHLMDTVAHDLRAPLTSIKAILGLLATGMLGELSPKALTRVNTAEHESERLVRLINDLLDFDKLESGRTELELKKTPIQQIINTSISSIDQLANEKDITIDAPATSVVAEADADRLVQVLVNLLSNAIKFSPTGGTIEISNEIDGGFIKVRVKDHGEGISPDLQAEIFERFKQIKSDPQNRAVKGTGLGLPIASQIVRAHGGKIGVDSVPGEGSTFWFTVPEAIDGRQEHTSKLEEKTNA